MERYSIKILEIPNQFLSSETFFNTKSVKQKLITMQESLTVALFTVSTFMIT